MLDRIKQLFKKKRELILYIFFGGLTTVVSFASYFLFRWIFPDEASVPFFLKWIYRLADIIGTESKTVFPNLLSWICAVTFAYVTNRIWVFESRERRFIKVVREAGLFFAARLTTLLIDLVMMFLLVDLTGISGGWYELFAKVAVSVVVLTLNYIFSKLFVFRKK